MNLKKLILAGVGAAAFIGSADAVTLTVTKIADAAGPFTTVAPLKVASEMLQGNTVGANNNRDETIALATFSVVSGTFPSGNVIVNASISGATFDAALTGLSLDFADCTAGATAVISTGGAEGSTSVSWVVSNLDKCLTTDVVVVTLPLDLDLVGAPVSVTLGVVTESGSTPVDGGPQTVSSFITTTTPAYSASIKAAAASTVTANVSEVTGAYKKFVATTVPSIIKADLGSVQLKADTAVAIDISGTLTKAIIGDYLTASIVATGDLTAFQEVVDPVSLDGTIATSKTTTAATFAAVEGGAFGTAFTGAAVFAVETDADTAIPASTYTIAVTPTLEAALTGAGNLAVSSTAATAVSNIARNGTSVKLPWVVSATQAGASGTGAVNFIRVTNRTAVAFGPITATVLASNNAGSLAKTAQLAPSLAAGSELLVNSGSLETLLGSNFGRGDIEVTVEGAGATVVQLVARPDGVYTIDNQ